MVRCGMPASPGGVPLPHSADIPPRSGLLPLKSRENRRNRLACPLQRPYPVPAPEPLACPGSERNDGSLMTGHAKTTIRRPFHRGVIIGAVLIVELLALVVAYQFFAQITCDETGAFETCRFLRGLVARALVVFAAFGVLIWARPAPFSAFLTASARHSSPVWMALHLAGVALLWLPLIIMGLEDK